MIENVTILMFLYDGKFLNHEADQKLVEDLLPTYLEVFNQLKKEIFSYGHRGERARKFLIAKNCADLDPSKTPVAVLFPSTQHDSGQCALALVQLLMETHNIMLDRFAEGFDVIKNDTRSYFNNYPISQRISLIFQEQSSILLPNPILASEELGVNQLVCYDEEALNLVLMANCEYTLDVTKTHQIRWQPKKEGFEKDVVER